MLAAVASNFSEAGNDFAVAAVVIAVLASLMVSYTRARAEALGVECKVGIADRAVRVVILAAGLVLEGVGLLEPAVYVLGGLALITVGQRIWHVRSSSCAPPKPGRGRARRCNSASPAGVLLLSFEPFQRNHT